MRQLQLFTTTELAAMRDRTASRSYSPAAEEFRREHERHRAWGLTQRHAERLRRSRGSHCEPHTATATGTHPERRAPTPPPPAVSPRSTPPDLVMRPTASPESVESQNPGVTNAADPAERQGKGSTQPAAIASSRPAGDAPSRRAEKAPERPARSAPGRPVGKAPDAPIGKGAQVAGPVHEGRQPAKRRTRRGPRRQLRCHPQRKCTVAFSAKGGSPHAGDAPLCPRAPPSRPSGRQTSATPPSAASRPQRPSPWCPHPRGASRQNTAEQRLPVDHETVVPTVDPGRDRSSSRRRRPAVRNTPYSPCCKSCMRYTLRSAGHDGFFPKWRLT
jgi:hypothetical protein